MKLTALQEHQMENKQLKEMQAKINATDPRYGYTDEQLQGWILRNDWQASDREARTAINDARSLHLS